MSEDDETDEVIPRKRSPQQAEIARLMYREGLDYATSYSRVMEPEKQKQKPFDWYADQPPTPQPKAKQFSLSNLETLANEINDALEDVSTKKATLREKAASFQVKKDKIIAFGKELLADKKQFIEDQKQFKEKAEIFNALVEDYNRKVTAFNEGIQKLAEIAEQEERNVKGYIKKINVDAQREFKK